MIRRRWFGAILRGRCRRTRTKEGVQWRQPFTGLARENASGVRPQSRSKATSEVTSGSLYLGEAVAQPGFPGPPPHFHEHLHDMFYVLDGTLTVQLGDQTTDLEPGTFVCVPPGVVHTFSNPGDSPVRFLNFNAPAGWENYIEGDPGMRMNPIYADDAAAAIEAALALERQEVINVAGAEVVTVTDLVRRLAAALGTKGRVRHTDGSPGDLVADTTRMRTVLGFHPDTSLDEGLGAVAQSIAVGSATQG